ncbi:MAG: hypothetical protein ABR985_06195 [Methanotrichaceae archaeon]|jgi:hypothetical protein
MISDLRELILERRRLIRLQECLVNQLVETRLKLDAIEQESAFAAVMACCGDYSGDESDGGSEGAA